MNGVSLSSANSSFERASRSSQGHEDERSSRSCQGHEDAVEECSAQRSPRGCDLVTLKRAPSRVAGQNWPESRSDVEEELDFHVGPLPSLLDLMMRREQMSSDCSPSNSDQKSVHARADAYLGNALTGLLALLQERRAGKRAVPDDAPPCTGPRDVGSPFRKRFRCEPPLHGPCEGEGLSHDRCAVVPM